jgi:2-amino-4-hydroxy-6-hydroxymethyldihydropteridine diphosphokinase
MMHMAYLSLGSNLGDRGKYLLQAREAARESFRRVRESAVYETEPVDFLDQPWFLNQILEIETDLEPETLLEWIRSLEQRLGRQRDIFKGPRTLDVDILLYDERVVQGEDLVLPHPRLAARRHVLVPLCELAGNRRLPGDARTLREILESVQDKAQVRPYAST